MGVRDSFSRLKKKLKRGPGRTGAGDNGENIDPLSPPEHHTMAGDGEGDEIDADEPNPANPLPRPDPHTVVGDGEGSEADTDAQQARSMDRPPQPDESESVPANRRESDKSGGKADVDEMELGQGSEVEVGAGSEPGGEWSEDNREEGEEFDSSSSAPSTPRSGEPDGMRTRQLWSPPLTISSDNINTTVPDHAPEGPYPDVSVEQSAATNETMLGGGSTSVTVKLLCVVRDSVNGFGPLKSIARGLCLVLENCGVWLSSCRFNSQCSQLFQHTGVDEQAIELLAPQVKVLSESLCVPIPPGDISERGREKERERKLEQ